MKCVCKDCYLLYKSQINENNLPKENILAITKDFYVLDSKVNKNCIPVLTIVILDEYKYSYIRDEFTTPVISEGFPLQSKSFLQQALILPHIVDERIQLLEKILYQTTLKQNADWYWIRYYNKVVMLLERGLTSTDPNDVKMVNVNWYLKTYANFCHFVLGL